MKILLVKLGAIGDIIHTLPVLAAIRRELPGAEVSWVAERRSAEILRGNTLIDNLIEVDTRSIRDTKSVDKVLVAAAAQIKNLRSYNFDIAVDFQGLLKSGVIAKISGAKKRWGFSRSSLREPAARVFYTNSVKVPKMSHVISRNLKLAAGALNLHTTDQPHDFPIFTDNIHIAEANEISAGIAGEFALLNPAGGWVTKLWHAEKYGQLADAIWDTFGIPSIVVAGPNESELASRVIAASRSGHAIAAEPSLKGFYELARRSRVYIGGDTGPTHLAIAAGAPIVGIFGPTEWWRNGSPNADDICVERLDIGCRVDCHRRTCTNWICMDITVETVIDAVRRRLGKPASVLSRT